MTTKDQNWESNNKKCQANTMQKRMPLRIHYPRRCKYKTNHK